MRKVGSVKRLSRAAVLMGLAAVLVGVPLAASANPDVSGFELDGNAASGGAADWNSLGSPLDFTGFIDDGTGNTDVGYGSGSNKDIDDVNTWSWAEDDVTPNKDNIVSAYASVYAEQSNLILYFGQTRLLDKNGDANVGFWFLQNPAGLNADGSFSGSHANGDILVQSEFTNGGSVSGVHIFKWQGGSLQLVSNQAQCSGGKLGTADACAIVNTSTISTSWAGSVTAPYFFEGGLNLTGLFPQGAPCFSTFLTNTRTSQSESAELKDFAFGDIDTCGEIKINKVATPGDGTQFGYATTGLSPTTFSLGNGGSRTFSKLQPGPYSVTEDPQTGSWAFDSLSCGNVSGPGTSASVNGQAVSITLGFLGKVECTYVNKRKPQVRVVKALVPVSDVGKFDLQINGTTHADDVGNGGDTGFKEVAPGQQVTVGELAGTGTDLANYVSSVSCDSGKGGSSSTSHSFTANLGDQVTCTITNQRKPEVKVVKVIEPANDSGKFNLLINGNVELANAGNGGNTGFRNVAVGGASVGETAGTGTNLGNYDSKVDCGSKGSTNPGTSHQFTVGYGDSVTCTITNTRKATLTVIKSVVNDNGGTKVASDFAIAVTGSSPSPANFSGAGAPGTSVTIGPGAYNVTETVDPAYDASYSAGCSGTIPAGGSATCTITNNDKAPKLTLVKQVVNDNGGTQQPSAWNLAAAGATGFNGAGPSVSSGPSFDAGSYNLSESGPAGYDASAWVCSKGQVDGDTVSVALGDDITCTITNDDRAPKLTLVKAVVNDNGGSEQASSWTLTAAGPTGFSGAGPSVSNGPSFDAGSYDLSESGPAGYDASAWVCSKGGVDRDTVSVGLGDDITCTITNDDEAPKLTLVKVVVNNSGGTALASEWNLAADGPTSIDGDGPSVSSGAGFDAGTYDLSESGGPAGYAASDWVCSSGGVDSDTVSVGLGDDVTCTITNDDQPAKLIVKKVVVNDNGGTATAADFGFQVNGGAVQPFEADGQNDLTVAAGTYNVSEPAEAGYTTSYQGCANIVLALGGTATCTVTNNDVPRGQGSISVSKSANPTSVKEPGGQVTFSVTITNTSADVDVAITDVDDSVFGDLDDDGGNGCFDVPVNLAPGGKVNCTFQRSITGAGGTSHVNVVTVKGVDENGNNLTASDDARVDITPRLIDLVIVKDASSPTPLNGVVNYSLTVTNKGPDTATNVQLADPAPAGITYLTASPSQGTCSLGPSLVTCDLGSIAAGQTVTIAITARATSVGSHTNTATVTGSGGRETNPADNVDSAVTIVPAPLKPPVARPQPKPSAEVCLSLTVSPKMTKADGKPDRVTAKVTAGAKRVKGAKVSINGAGVKKSARTNGKGVAVLRINPKKPGIIAITVVETNQKVCGPKRIGVVGVFLPPLTG